MEDWYNDSLLRYPKTLIQRERALPPPPQQIIHKGGNAIRISFHGRRSEGRELDAPNVTVYSYNTREGSPQSGARVTVKTGMTSIPVRHLVTTPVATNLAHSQKFPTTKNLPSVPMKALPLTSLLKDANANQIGLDSKDSLSVPSFFDVRQRRDSLPQDFEHNFERFTAECTSHGASPSPRGISPGRNSKSYAYHKHPSDSALRQNSTDIRLRARRKSHSSTDGLRRSTSPDVFLSTYSQPLGRYKSPVQSPPPPGATFQQRSKSFEETAEDAEAASVAKAKEVLDRVLKNLVSKDGLKGRRNSIVNEAKDSINKFKEKLDSSVKSRLSADDADSGYSGSGDTTKVGFTWSTMEIKEKVKKYNSNQREDSKFTEVAGKAETFQRDIQICMCLEHPVSMLLTTRPSSLFRADRQGAAEERITASATIPNNTITRLHITSEDNTDAVLEQLLNKFSIVESAKKYGLYEQTLNNDKEVKLRKTASSEKPLLTFLRWKTESQEQKRFIMKESPNSDILWESFSTPELYNFLQRLRMEQEEQVKTIRNKYLSYKCHIERRMAELSAHS